VAAIGKVYLVGAGPGHPELLTLKAAELLRAADVVVYDRLVQEEVLALAKPSAERLYMGKPVGKHDSRQEEIHELLARKAEEGKMVVRLKGGDPFVFGRGGEEAEYLAERGVPFEVIPGVSSALAAPLSAGIAVTHRDSSACVTILTGHEAKDEVSRLNWEALAKLETLVILMGVHNAGRIAQRLIENGRSPDTPAAMIQMAFWNDERVVTGTLATIAEEAEKAGIRPPATFVVGEVVRLREKLKHAQRDLKRRADGSSRFQPAPAPDQLLRLATAGLGSQALGFGLELRLFDRLERPSSAAALAGELGLDAGALEEMLEVLVALGILERRADGYQNLELASRYLRADSPESLRSMLLHQASQSCSWEELAAYARRGRQDFMEGVEEAAHQDSCEAVARFSAPAVAERLDLNGKGPVLLVGYGGEAYRDAIALRWPALPFQHRNPFAGPDAALKLLSPLPVSGGPYGAVILSGLLASCHPGQVQKILDLSAADLKPGGLLVLHDAFLPAGVLPPPEVLLAALGRHVRRGGCRTWSIARLEDTLRGLSMASVKVQPLPAGTVLVTAVKA
jgi:uroporphyrin-III C-methyltransferase